MVLLGDYANSYISGVAKTEFIAFRVAPELKRELQRIADDEQRALSQVCEMFLYEGVEGSKKEGAQVHAAPGRQTEGQGQRLLTWAGKTPLSIPSTAWVGRARW